METSKTTFSITSQKDLLEIIKAMPNGIIIFYEKDTGGSIFRSGDMEQLTRFASFRISSLQSYADRSVHDVFSRILTVMEEFKGNMKAFRELMKGQDAPAELPFEQMENFLTQNDATKFSVLVITCNDSYGFLSGVGDMIGIGSVLLSAMRDGNVPVFDLIRRIMKEAAEFRKKKH